MAREKFHTRLDPGDAERLSEYKEDHGIDQNSEALRRLIRRGLEAEGYKHEPDTGGSRAQWFAHRIGKYANYSMYTAIALGVITLIAGTGLWAGVGPTTTFAQVFLLAVPTLIGFVGVSAVLSVVAIALLVYDGMDWRDTMPWREPT